jgi:hypothetical protein
MAKRVLRRTAVAVADWIIVMFVLDRLALVAGVAYRKWRPRIVLELTE